mgnify:CR=1 FL=1
MLQQLRQVKFAIGSEIRHAHRSNGWLFVGVFGPKGWGKSSIVLYTLWEFYHDWDTVFKYFIFTPNDLMKMAFDILKKQEKDIHVRIALLGIDDMGVHFGKHRWSEEWAIELSEAWEAIRPCINAVIGSATSPSKVLNFMRDDLTGQSWIKIPLDPVKPRIKIRGWPYGMAEYHKVHEYPRYKLTTDRHPTFRKLWLYQLFYFPMIPTKWYEKYLILRQQKLLKEKFKKFKQTDVKEIAEQLTEQDILLLEKFAENIQLNRQAFKKGHELAHMQKNYYNLVRLGLVEIKGQHAKITDLGMAVHDQLNP